MENPIMNSFGTRSRLQRLILASLVATALAGCGGGGGDDSSNNQPVNPVNPTNPTVTVQSVRVPATAGSAIVGTTKTLTAVPIGSDGNPVSGKTVNWTSSDASRATVNASGVVSPISAGSVSITATVDGVSSAIALTITQPPATLQDLLTLFPFVQADAVRTDIKSASDISSGYSSTQQEHLMKSWNFFTDYFGREINPPQIHYTWDRGFLDYAIAQYPADCASPVAELPGRALIFCSQPGALVWLVAPNLRSDGSVPPDFATDLATLGQAFLDSFTDTMLNWRWLRDGFGFAIKYGTFNQSGQYTMQNVGQPENSTFKQALAAGTLIPLSQLVQATTWTPEQTDLAIAQSAMLINYVFRNNGGANRTDLADTVISSGTFSGQTPDVVFNDLLTRIGKTIDEVETAYRAWGLAN